MNLLPLLFVGLGVVLLLAAWAVWHQGRRVRECVRDLLALPDETHPMDWPLQARTVLQRAGIGGMAWQGQWFGDPVQGQWGNAAQPDWTGLTLDAGPDCSLELSWAGLARTDEAQALALVVVDVFVQGWLSRMRQRTQAVKEALLARHPGIAEDRIELVGRGWEEPLGADSEQNRRVEVQWFTLE